MKIKIIKDMYMAAHFDGDEYEIDLDRQFGGYEEGDLICSIQPFHMPLTLDIAIRRNGELIFRGWEFSTNGNPYLHTGEKCKSDCATRYDTPFEPTQEQIDTVNGLFSGRIKFEGLELPVGASVQKICHIDLANEEQLIGKKILVM